MSRARKPAAGAPAEAAGPAAAAAVPSGAGDLAREAGPAAAATVPPPGPGGFGLVVVVTGPPQGFRRIGRRFGPEPVAIPLEELGEDEKAALAAEPMLTVATVAAPAG